MTAGAFLGSISKIKVNKYMNKSLFALASGTFALGIAEFVIMAILSDIAGDVGISISEAGHLISAYALGVSVGAPFLLIVRKLPLKTILLILASLIMVGNLFAALASGYHALLVARFISGFPHGCYFGVGAIVAERISGPGKGAAAVSMVIAGMTLATTIGVPLGTMFSTYLSWRITFAFVALSGAMAFIGILAWIKNDVGKVRDNGFLSQFRFLHSWAPWLIFAGPLFGQAGLYCWYSYIDPLMTDVAGFSPASMTWLMVIAGAGMFAGNIIGGRCAVRYNRALVAALIQGTSIITLVLIFFFAGNKVAAVLLMVIGAAQLFASGGPLQSIIIKYSKGGELLGGSLIQISYNLGNAISAWIGSMVIAAGYRYRMTVISGLPFTIIGTALLFVLYFRYERLHQ